MDEKQFDQLDMLTIFSTILAVKNYTGILKQASNDDLLEELKHQNTKYMDKLLEQNREIIKLLKGDMKNASNEI